MGCEATADPGFLPVSAQDLVIFHYATITFNQTNSYLPSCRALVPLVEYQIILLDCLPDDTAQWYLAASQPFILYQN